MPENRLKPFRLKLFRKDEFASYVVHDANQALILDPHLELMEEYRDFLRANGLKLAGIVDTQLHDDHPSGSHVLKSEWGAPILMSARTRSDRPDRRLEDGDKLQVGTLVLEAFEAPGHAPDAICLRLAADGFEALFAGNTLRIGGAAPGDRPDSDPALLWESIRRVMGRLGDAAVIFPSHNDAGLLFTTGAAERAHQADWTRLTQAEFVARRAPYRFASWPEHTLGIREFNRVTTPAGAFASSAVLRETRGPARPDLLEDVRISTINIEKYAHKLEERAPDIAHLDVRDPEEFEAGHIPGIRNVPVSELALHLGELTQFRRVYTSCLVGKRSTPAAMTLSYLGFPDVVNVSGGYKAWLNAELPVEK